MPPVIATFPFESIPSPEALTSIYPPPMVISAFESLFPGLPSVDEPEADGLAALIPSSLAVISILPPVTVTF